MIHQIYRIALSLGGELYSFTMTAEELSKFQIRYGYFSGLAVGPLISEAEFATVFPKAAAHLVGETRGLPAAHLPGSLSALPQRDIESTRRTWENPSGPECDGL